VRLAFVNSQPAGGLGDGDEVGGGLTHVPPSAYPAPPQPPSAGFSGSGFGVWCDHPLHADQNGTARRGVANVEVGGGLAVRVQSEYDAGLARCQHAGNLVVAR
jgi:hypothetical protein